METTAAKNYLENTNLKFKFKAGAAIGTAAYLLILVLIEEIAGVVLPSFWGDIYLIGGIALMVITGSIFRETGEGSEESEKGRKKAGSRKSVRIHKS